MFLHGPSTTNHLVQAKGGEGSGKPSLQPLKLEDTLHDLLQRGAHLVVDLTAIPAASTMPALSV